jgi:hypothetical protein
MIYIVNNLKQVDQAYLTLFHDGYRDFHPVRNIELLGALPLKVTEIFAWHPFPCEASAPILYSLYNLFQNASLKSFNIC